VLSNIIFVNLNGMRHRSTVYTRRSTHCTTSSLQLKKWYPGRLIGRTKGGMNTKLHAVTDQNGRPLSFFMTAEQISD